MVEPACEVRNEVEHDVLSERTASRKSECYELVQGKVWVWKMTSSTSIAAPSLVADGLVEQPTHRMFCTELR